MKVKVTHLCPTLCDPIDCSPSGSCVDGILQARTLEWVAISFSTGSSWHRDQTRVSHIGGRSFTIWATREMWRFVTKLVWVWSRLLISSPVMSQSFLISLIPGGGQLWQVSFGKSVLWQLMGVQKVGLYISSFASDYSSKLSIRQSGIFWSGIFCDLSVQ